MLDPNDPDLLINAVAIDSDPVVVWQVFCEICDDLVDEPTSCGDLIDSRELEHRKFHGFSIDTAQKYFKDEGRGGCTDQNRCTNVPLPLMTDQIVRGRFYSFNKKMMKGVDSYR